MGSKLKKVALPLAAVGLMAATGGAAAPAFKGSLMGSGMVKGALAKAAGTAATTTAAPTGIAGLFSKMAGSTIGKGLMANLANPLSLKGAATYGALGMAGKGLMGDKQRKLDTSKDDDAAQAAYDYHMMMSKGIMSPEDARKSFATYGKGMKGCLLYTSPSPRD